VFEKAKKEIEDNIASLEKKLKLFLKTSSQ
jgi:hypothetical protein